MQLYNHLLPSPASIAELANRRSMQQKLLLLLHANKCRRQQNQAQFAGEEWQQCTVQECRDMRRVLNHLKSCKAGKNCTVTDCILSRQIIIHWTDCKLDNCAYCLPIKQLDINITYNLNETGEAYDVDLKHSFDILDISRNNMDDSVLKETITKNYLPDECRARIVQKMALKLLPAADGSTFLNKRLHRLTASVMKIEGEMFELANTSTEYYHMLSEKYFYWKDQMEMKRKEHGQNENAGGLAPPDSRSATPPLR